MRLHGSKRRKMRIAWLPTQIEGRWIWLRRYVAVQRWTEKVTERTHVDAEMPARQSHAGFWWETLSRELVR